MQSLKDKLLKAGLVSQEQAQKAEEKKQVKPPERQVTARAPSRPAHPRRTPVSRLPPLPGSKEAQRNEARKQVQLDRFLREKVLEAQVPIESGSTVFYFVTRKQKLRRLELSPTQAKMLEEGKLAVVERPDPDRIEHALVPPEAAAALFSQSEKAVRFWNREGQAVGFLTEAQIAARHTEADEPEPEGPSPEAAGETWITIKRA